MSAGRKLDIGGSLIMLLALGFAARATSNVSAYEFRARWVERVGSSDIVIGGDGAILDASDGAPRRVRLQFGVFDDGGEPAPAGGFVGWIVGTLTVSGAADNSDETRTPGRLTPFVFSTDPGANGNPPLPDGDPFTVLTDIDATLGTQSPIWGCDSEGNPFPQPPANVRGLNTYLSVYEFTIDPRIGGIDYTVTAAGNLIAATEWRTVGTPTPPDCDAGIPGSVTYAPFPTAPLGFTCVLDIQRPVPTGACCQPDGYCAVLLLADCTGVWHAEWTSCDPENPCPQPGACCFVDGSCQLLTEADCQSASGYFQGDGTECDPNPCLPGACCQPDGSCAITLEADCTGVWRGEWTSCDPENPCPQPGACCAVDGSCQVLLETECLAAMGAYQGDGTDCDPNPCPQPGACCQPDGSCVLVPEFLCTGDWHGEWTSCIPNPCPKAAGEWQTEIVDTVGIRWNERPSLAVAGDGTPHVAYHNVINEDLNLAMRVGGAWQIEIVPNRSYWMDPSLVFDVQGRPHIAHYRWPSYLAYTHWTGSDWQSSDIAYSNPAGTLALTAAGEPRIAYRQHGDPGDVLLYAVPSGSSWSVQTICGSGYGCCGGYPALAFDSNDNPHVGWAYHENFVYLWHDGVVWHSEWLGSKVFYETAALVLDSADNPHIVYYDDWGDVIYGHRTAAGWSFETIVSGGSASGITGLAFDPHEHLYVAFIAPGGGPSPSMLKCAHWTPSGWEIQTVDTESCSRVSIATDPSGNPHIAYLRNNPLAVKHAWWEPTPGACCDPLTGECSLEMEADCLAGGGVFQGVGTSCDPNPCPQLGACCFDYGACQVLTEAECATAGGAYQGDETDCDPNPCLEPITIETVPVGNPGNGGEWSGESYGGYGPDRICGAVDYEYNIGKYEVTAGQYTAFLNAVAATDTYGLYNSAMWSSTYACKIEQTGSSGSYTYSVAADWANRPVNYVSYWDACRFANWLHNNQPTGAQGPGTTETGAYTLNGYNGQDGREIQRNPGWNWAVTSEDEWYKAAYHKHDGVTGNYWDYPMGSSPFPDNGNPGGDSGNSANFYDGDYTIGSPYWRTPVGYFSLSDSPYGTFDQGGNVWEWNESVVYEGSDWSDRGLRGGSFYSIFGNLRAAYRFNGPPTYESGLFGFRVSEVVVGACCFSDGSCQVLSSPACAAGGGTLQGDGTNCDPNPCPPPNDTCDTAVDILAVPFGDPNVNFVYATDDAYPNPSCDSSSCTAVANGIWYTYTPAANGVAWIEVIGEQTVLSLWQGPDCLNLTEVACKDTVWKPIRMQVPLAGGVRLWMLVSYWHCPGEPAQAITFNFDSQPPPANDDCASAAELVVPGETVFDTRFAADDPQSQAVCTTGLVNQAMWYYVIGDGTTYTATTCNPGGDFGDTKLQVWCGDCAALHCVLGNDDMGAACPISTLRSQVIWCTIPGARYLIAAGGYGTEMGFMDLTVSSDGVPCAGGDPVCAPPGACCRADGSCEETTAAACTGTWEGAWTTCTPNPCPPAGACCFADKSCQFLTNAACTQAGGTWRGMGTNCQPNPCRDPGDDCDHPLVIPGIPYTDTNTTCGHGDDYYNTSLGEWDEGEDIIYQFTLATNACLSFHVDGTSPTCGLMVRDQCGPGGPTGGGFSGGCNQPIIDLSAGTYYLMIDSQVPPDCIQEFTLTIDYATTGACCFMDSCVGDLTEAGCLAGGGTWHYCESCAWSYVCPPPLGACCFDGACLGDVPYEECCLYAGEWFEGESCGTFTCPPPTMAACCVSGMCIGDMPRATCISQMGRWMEGQSCYAGFTCPTTAGVCCLPDGSCVNNQPEFLCCQAGGTWSPASSCAESDACPITTAACCVNGMCVGDQREGECLWAGGQWYPGQSCTDPEPPCPPAGACCFADASCDQLPEDNCLAAGGASWIAATPCTPNPCPPLNQLGDLNCDHAVNLDDVSPFVLALIDPVGYAAGYPDCSVDLADTNGDGVVNGGDVQPFIDLLLGV